MAVEVTIYTNKDWGRRVKCVPGLLDDACIEAFCYGYCHVMALELHERTGWPLIAVWYKSDTDLPGHIAVQHPDGWIVDVQGAYDEDPEGLEIKEMQPIDESDIMMWVERREYKRITKEMREMAALVADEVLENVRELAFVPEAV